MDTAGPIRFAVSPDYANETMPTVALKYKWNRPPRLFSIQVFTSIFEHSSSPNKDTISSFLWHSSFNPRYAQTSLFTRAAAL